MKVVAMVKQASWVLVLTVSSNYNVYFYVLRLDRVYELSLLISYFIDIKIWVALGYSLLIKEQLFFHSQPYIRWLLLTGSGWFWCWHNTCSWSSQSHCSLKAVSCINRLWQSTSSKCCRSWIRQIKSFIQVVSARQQCGWLDGCLLGCSVCVWYESGAKRTNYKHEFSHYKSTISMHSWSKSFIVV